MRIVRFSGQFRTLSDCLQTPHLVCSERPISEAERARRHSGTTLILLSRPGYPPRLGGRYRFVDILKSPSQTAETQKAETQMPKLSSSSLQATVSPEAVLSNAASDSVSGFSDSIARLSDRIDYRLANSDKQREAIFRLRYQAYVRDGTISPNSSRTFSDVYDETGNVYLLGLYIDDELASSIRLHSASSKHPNFPSLEVFADVCNRNSMPAKSSSMQAISLQMRAILDSIADYRMPRSAFACWRLDTSARTIFSPLSARSIAFSMSGLLTTG